MSQVDLEIEYCPKVRMWADILTNTFQGRSFRQFRTELMNLPVDYEDNDSACEDAGNITGASNTNIFAPTGGTKTSYISYS